MVAEDALLQKLCAELLGAGGGEGRRVLVVLRELETGLRRVVGDAGVGKRQWTGEKRAGVARGVVLAMKNVLHGLTLGTRTWDDEAAATAEECAKIVHALSRPREANGLGAFTTASATGKRAEDLTVLASMLVIALANLVSPAQTRPAIASSAPRHSTSDQKPNLRSAARCSAAAREAAVGELAACFGALIANAQRVPVIRVHLQQYADGGVLAQITHSLLNLLQEEAPRIQQGALQALHNLHTLYPTKVFWAPVYPGTFSHLYNFLTQQHQMTRRNLHKDGRDDRARRTQRVHSASMASALKLLCLTTCTVTRDAEHAQALTSAMKLAGASTTGTAATATAEGELRTEQDALARLRRLTSAQPPKQPHMPEQGKDDGNRGPDADTEWQSALLTRIGTPLPLALLLGVRHREPSVRQAACTGCTAVLRSSFRFLEPMVPSLVDLVLTLAADPVDKIAEQAKQGLHVALNDQHKDAAASRWDLVRSNALLRFPNVVQSVASFAHAADFGAVRMNAHLACGYLQLIGHSRARDVLLTHQSDVIRAMESTMRMDLSGHVEVVDTQKISQDFVVSYTRKAFTHFTATPSAAAMSVVAIAGQRPQAFASASDADDALAAALRVCHTLGAVVPTHVLVADIVRRVCNSLPGSRNGDSPAQVSRERYMAWLSKALPATFVFKECLRGMRSRLGEVYSDHEAKNEDDMDVTTAEDGDVAERVRAFEFLWGALVHSDVWILPTSANPAVLASDSAESQRDSSKSSSSSSSSSSSISAPALALTLQNSRPEGDPHALGDPTAFALSVVESQAPGASFAARVGLPVSYDIASSNAVLLSLLLEALGSFFDCLGAALQPHLQFVLFALLEREVDSNPVVERAAVSTLERLARSQGFVSAHGLVSANFDYLVDAACRQLRALLHDLQAMDGRASAGSSDVGGVAALGGSDRGGGFRAVRVVERLLERHHVVGAELPVLRDLLSDTVSVLDSAQFAAASIRSAAWRRPVGYSAAAGAGVGAGGGGSVAVARSTADRAPLQMLDAAATNALISLARVLRAVLQTVPAVLRWQERLGADAEDSGDALPPVDFFEEQQQAQEEARRAADADDDTVAVLGATGVLAHAHSCVGGSDDSMLNRVLQACYALDTLLVPPDDAEDEHVPGGVEDIFKHDVADIDDEHGGQEADDPIAANDRSLFDAQKKQNRGGEKKEEDREEDREEEVQDDDGADGLGLAGAISGDADTAGVRLLREVLERCVHFLSVPVLPLQITVLGTVEKALGGLSESYASSLERRKRVLLPQVHIVWGPTLQLLHEAGRRCTGSVTGVASTSLLMAPTQFQGGENPWALARAVLRVVHVSVELCGDFLSSKFPEELWPTVRGLLSAWTRATHVKMPQDGYTTQETRTVYRAVCVLRTLLRTRACERFMRPLVLDLVTTVLPMTVTAASAAAAAAAANVPEDPLFVAGAEVLAGLLWLDGASALAVMESTASPARPFAQTIRAVHRALTSRAERATHLRSSSGPRLSLSSDAIFLGHSPRTIRAVLRHLSAILEAT